jgi:hypothetical protein
MNVFFSVFGRDNQESAAQRFAGRETKRTNFILSSLIHPVSLPI